jgi:putative ABC transport system permease protein
LSAARISPLEALRVQGRTGEAIRAIVWASGLALMFIGFTSNYGIPYRDSVAFNMLMINVVLIFLGAILTVPLVIRYLEKFTRKLAVRVYGREGLIGSSNVNRSIGRTTLTVASLIVSLAMIVGIGSMSHSFENDLTSWVNASLGGDLYVNSPVRLRESFGRQLEGVEGVEVASPARFMVVQIAPRSLPPDVEEDDDTVFYYIMDPESYLAVGSIEFTTDQGNPDENIERLKQGNAVFLSSVLADKLELDRGDTLYLQTGRGVQPFEVAGVIVDFFAQGQTITGTYRDLKTWFGLSGADRFTVKVADGYDPAAVAQALRDRFQKSRNISVQNTESFKKQIDDILNQSLALFDVLSSIGVVIGTLGVVNTLTMNVMERTREIGGLRSLGMTRSQVIRMILSEALGLGTMGMIYGLGFGFLFAQVIINALNRGNGYDLSFSFNPMPFLSGALLAIGISQIAALSPARRASRLNIVEAIKHE